MDGFVRPNRVFVMLVWVVCMEKLVGGKRLEACCRASFMGFDDALYLVWNSSSVRIDVVLGCWICCIVVMPYMYSLMRYFLEFACCSRVSNLNVGVLCQIVSIGILARGNSSRLVLTWILYSLSSTNMV